MSNPRSVPKKISQTFATRCVCCGWPKIHYSAHAALRSRSQLSAFIELKSRSSRISKLPRHPYLPHPLHPHFPRPPPFFLFTLYVLYTLYTCTRNVFFWLTRCQHPLRSMTERWEKVQPWTARWYTWATLENHFNSIAWLLVTAIERVPALHFMRKRLQHQSYEGPTLLPYKLML